MFLLGGLLGHATDLMTASEQNALDEQRKRCQLEEANLRYAEAIEINDSLIQEMVAAKWMVEQGLTDQATEVLTATIATGERMVAELLPKRVSSGGSTNNGATPKSSCMLRASRGRLFTGRAATRRCPGRARRWSRRRAALQRPESPPMDGPVPRRGDSRSRT